MASLCSIKKVEKCFMMAAQFTQCRALFFFVVGEKHKTRGDLRSCCFQKPPPDLLVHSLFPTNDDTHSLCFTHVGLFRQILNPFFPVLIYIGYICGSTCSHHGQNIRSLPGLPSILRHKSSVHTSTQTFTVKPQTWANHEDTLY